MSSKWTQRQVKKQRPHTWAHTHGTDALKQEARRLKADAEEKEEEREEEEEEEVLQILGESSRDDEFYARAASMQEVSLLVLRDRHPGPSNESVAQTYLFVCRTMLDLPQNLEHPIPFRSHRQHQTASHPALTCLTLVPYARIPRLNLSHHRLLPRRLHRLTLGRHPCQRASLFSGAAAQNGPHSRTPGANPLLALEL